MWAMPLLSRMTWADWINPGNWFGVPECAFCANSSEEQQESRMKPRSRRQAGVVLPAGTASGQFSFMSCLRSAVKVVGSRSVPEMKVDGFSEEGPGNPSPPTRSRTEAEDECCGAELSRAGLRGD